MATSAFRAGDHCTEGDEEEDLDNELEREFQRTQCPSSPLTAILPLKLQNLSCSSSSLTFAFPGWGVQIFRDGKRRKPSIIRHGFEEAIPQQQHQEQQPLFRGFADDPGDGRSIYRMPIEILTIIFKRLSIRDLCSAMRTCHWWQHIGRGDEVWERFHSCTDSGGDHVPIPKWAIVKHDTLSAQVQSRVAFGYGYLCKGFMHLRRALRAWWEWESEVPDGPYGYKSVGGLLHKMSMHDWTLVYEFLGVAFSERVECLAALLLREVQKQADKHARSICPFGCDHQSGSSGIELLSDSDSLLDFSKLSPSASLSDKGQPCVESMVGKSLWAVVCLLWKRYRQWLMLVFEHCPRLNHQVMIEKARTTTWTTTPTLYEKGVICFRSQVLLRYGLRRILQSGFVWLSSCDANGLTSDVDVDLLRSVRHLLQEMDVRDDTISSQAFTQTKMWRCFPVKGSCDSEGRLSLDNKHKKKLSERSLLEFNEQL